MEHYYSEKQESDLNIRKIRQKIRNADFEFYTSSGVFSKERIDKGTLLLAENMRGEHFVRFAFKDNRFVDGNFVVFEHGIGWS